MIAFWERLLLPAGSVDRQYLGGTNKRQCRPAVFRWYQQEAVLPPAQRAKLTWVPSPFLP